MNKMNYHILKYASRKCIDHGRMLHTDLNILAYQEIVTQLFCGLQCHLNIMGTSLQSRKNSWVQGSYCITVYYRCGILFFFNCLINPLAVKGRARIKKMDFLVILIALKVSIFNQTCNKKLKQTWAFIINFFIKKNP